jgi:hypothetical protein
MSPDRPTESLMAFPSDGRRAQPGDQADGLRRLFSTRTVRFIPVVSNPFVAQEGVLIRQICAALDQLGLYTLLVDVCDAPRHGLRDTPRHKADLLGQGLDLADRIQVLTDRTASLSARGLPARWSDVSGSTQAFLQALIDAAPLSQAVVVHGSASELARMFGRGELQLSRPRPIVLCDEQPDSMTHAYAALKVLSQRVDWLSHDLLVSAVAGSAGIRLVKDRLAQCAALFFGGVRHDSVDIDPRSLVLPAMASASLMAFMEASMAAAAAFVLPEMGRRGPALVTSSPLLQPMV